MGISEVRMISLSPMNQQDESSAFTHFDEKQHQGGRPMKCPHCFGFMMPASIRKVNAIRCG
jgi:hypothetical protein